MKAKHYLLGLVIIAAVFAGYYFLKPEDAQIVYNTAVAEKGDIKVEVTATGKLNPVQAVQVGTQVSGTVSNVTVDFNSKVKKGQIIAEIDRTALLASLEDAKANVIRAQIQADQAKRDFDRSKQLFDEKVIPRVEFEAADATYKTALTSLNSSKSQLNRAEINLKFATITAPIDGVVINRAVDVGQTVAASFNTPTLFTIANDLTKMQVEANVDEADIGQVKVGQDVVFQVDAYPGEMFDGKVRQIRLLPVDNQNVITYTVIVDVRNPEEKLLPGMTANIRIIVKESKDVLKVPVAATRFIPSSEILEDFMLKVPDSVRVKMASFQEKKAGWGARKEGRPQGKAKVWVKSGELYVPVSVETGLSDGGFIEVKGKIPAGAEVVTGVIVTGGDAEGPASSPFAPQRMRGRRGR